MSSSLPVHTPCLLPTGVSRGAQVCCAHRLPGVVSQPSPSPGAPHRTCSVSRSGSAGRCCLLPSSWRTPTEEIKAGVGSLLSHVAGSNSRDRGSESCRRLFVPRLFLACISKYRSWMHQHTSMDIAHTEPTAQPDPFLCPTDPVCSQINNSQLTQKAASALFSFLFFSPCFGFDLLLRPPDHVLGQSLLLGKAVQADCLCFCFFLI